MRRAEAAMKGGVRLLQMREKGMGFRRALKRARALRALTREHDARLIINDSWQMAVESEADGVHLGREDEAFRLGELRSEIGDEMIIGI
ncbi:MAG: thiamine phosphate synthase, partial [Gammaproteobacteria bacterium]